VSSRIIERSARSAEVTGASSLLCAAAVRSSAKRMLALALNDSVDDWTVDLDRLPATAEFVAHVVRDRYPDVRPPLHARWRHFVFRGQDLWREIAAAGRWQNQAATARAAIDLVMISVLLDAGANPDWHYCDSASGLTAARSEGLALASLRLFESGLLSDDPGDPFRADAVALQRLTTSQIEEAFQVTASNPLSGAQGRATLLNRLGAVLQSRPELFDGSGAPRPGGLYDVFACRASQGALSAGAILETLLDALGPIWPDRPTLDGVSLGDCWLHPALQSVTPAQCYVPLHKLTQWLTYSLIEPLELAGLEVSRVEELTGLAEYRNGGLFVDTGVLRPRDSAAFSRTYAVSDPFVVGWRALTVALLDRLAPLVRARLGVAEDAFPLACMLEGGTWAAGRLIARDKRADGGPPFRILSDGTVF
jgi:Protein of unknown function (DUF1688)